MLPAILALLLQGALPQAADRPIRVWLGTDQPVAPGEQVQVFVRTARDGYLTVLRRTTDDRIEVLFPTNPTDASFVPAGTYEVRGSAGGGAFAALEPPGRGLVLAALSTTPFRTREFVHQAAWNPAALEPSWDEADAEGALTDIVQRMLGAGYFVYDLVPYVVAPPRAPSRTPIAGAERYETCVGCVFPTVTVVVAQPPVLVCDPFFLLCEDLFFVPRRHRLDRQPPEPPAGSERVLGIPSGSGVPGGVVAHRAERPRLVIPERPAAPPPTEPRSRTPDQARSRSGLAARATPVLRGRRPPDAPGARSSSAVSRSRVLRLVMPATPTRPARPAPAALVPAGPTATPARDRATLGASSDPASVTSVTRAAGAAIAPRARALVVPVRSAAATAATVARPAAASAGRIRAPSRVRAVVEARKRPR